MPPYVMRLSGASLGCPDGLLWASRKAQRGDLPRDPLRVPFGTLKTVLGLLAGLSDINDSSGHPARRRSLARAYAREGILPPPDLPERSRLSRTQGVSQVLRDSGYPQAWEADAHSCTLCPRRPEAPSPGRSEAASRSAFRPSSRCCQTGHAARTVCLML